MIGGSLGVVDGHWDDLLKDRVLAFLTAPRTAESITEWSRRVECRHEPHAELGLFARHLHVLIINKYKLTKNQYRTNLVCELMRHMGHVLTEARRGCDTRSVVTRRRTESGTTGYEPQLWPQDCRQLLPYGGRDSC
jgi:hypothetical protein